MRAMVLERHNQPLVEVDRPQPSPPEGRDGGLVLDVTACGVCHSDIHVVDGDFGRPPPMVLGHEITGVHPDLGPVMVYAPWGCGHCRQCGEGEEMICSNSMEAGLFTDGGYAEQVWVPDRRYLEPLDGLDPYTAAPLACGGLTAYRAVQHGVERLRALGSEGRALVIGAGGLGQYAIGFLRLQTDAKVTALDLSAAKRGRSLELGAHEAVEALAEDQTFDVIIDFVGVDATVGAGAAHVAKRGVMTVVGLGGGTTPFGFGAVPLETTFIASVWGTRAEMSDLLELARREPSVLLPVEVLPLADAQVAHERLRSGEAKGRIVLDVSGASAESKHS